MPIRSKIFKDINLLYTEFYGPVSIKDAYAYAERIYRLPDIESAKNTLIVFKNSNIDFEVEEIETIAKKILANRKVSYRERIAIIIDSPTETVVATLYAQVIASHTRKLKVELFYTLDAALQFLKLTGMRDRIVDIIFENAKKKV